MSHEAADIVELDELVPHVGDDDALAEEVTSSSSEALKVCRLVSTSSAKEPAIQRQKHRCGIQVES